MATTRKRPHRTVAAGFTLAGENPEYARDWHPSKNLASGLTPETVAPGSPVKVWWLCRKGHEYQLPVNKRTRHGRGCGQCAKEGRTIAAVGGAMADQFHPSKNAPLTTATVTVGATRMVAWRCRDCGYEWENSPANRTRFGLSGCPECTGASGRASNVLTVTHKELADRYHWLNEVPADQVRPGSQELRYWQCEQNPVHVWLAEPAARTRPKHPSGCPVCNKRGWTRAAVVTSLLAMLADGAALDAFAPVERAVLFARLGLDRVNDAAQAEQVATFLAGGMSFADLYLAAGGDAEELTRARAVAAARGDHPGFERPVDPDAPAPQGAAALPQMAAGAAPFPDLAEAGTDAAAILAPLDSVLTAAPSIEGEVLDWLMDARVARLWAAATACADEASRQALLARARAGARGEMGTRVVEDFTAEYAAVAALELPASWRGHTPNLMQRLTAHRVRVNRRVANWSGTGAGKTTSALLSAGVIGADVVLVVCPNATVDGWRAEIAASYPGAQVATKDLLPSFAAPTPGVPRFVLVNFEALQQPAARARVETFLHRSCPDMVIIDELHFAKQREAAVRASRRRTLLSRLLVTAAEQNPGLAVLAMTATPVLNELAEAVSVLELVTGQEMPELGTTPTVDNAYGIHAALSRVGLRLSGPRVPFDVLEVPVDASHLVEELTALGPDAHVLAVDQVLTRARIPAIVEACRRGRTLVYTHYVEGIVDELVAAVRAAGLRAAVYTGTHKTGLEEFKAARVDVLVASAPVATGVDGLQKVSHQLVVNAPPWTAAEMDQLIGRLARQGQQHGRVQVVLPVASVRLGEESWTFDANRLARVEFKRQLAQAAVDGVVPEGREISTAEFTAGMLARLEHLRRSAPMALVHPALTSDLTPREHTRAALVGPVRQAGPLAREHSRMYRAHSTRTHDRFTGDPAQHRAYHHALAGLRQGWEVDPVVVAAGLLGPRAAGLVVADLGCGDTARLAGLVGHRHTVHSFDHVSHGPGVVAADIAAVPLPAGSVDVAVLSLALMGANCADYLREAHRILRPGGQLMLWEPAGRVPATVRFAAQLERLGFDEVDIVPVGRFVQALAVRAGRGASARGRVSLGAA